MKMTGQIKPWEWARMKRGFLAGDSYTTLARRYGRSRSTIAAHGRAYKWQEQRQSIRAIRETASVQQCLRRLEFSESLLMEYVEKLRVSEKLERVQQAKSDLDSQSAGARMVDLFS